MARVDPVQAAAPLPPAEKHRRRISLRMGFRLIGFIVLLAAIGWLCLVTGFWQPPVLSSWFYEEPRPLREVSAIAPDDSIALEISLTGEASVALHEQELTALARTQDDFPLADPVMVVTDEDVQLHGGIPSQTQMKMLIHFVPSIEDGELAVEITSATLGELSIPAPLLGVSSRLLESVILSPLPQFDEVRNLDLTDQKLIFDVML